MAKKQPKLVSDVLNAISALEILGVTEDIDSFRKRIKKLETAPAPRGSGGSNYIPVLVGSSQLTGSLRKLILIGNGVTATDQNGDVTLNITGGSGDVSSVFGRTGAVTAQSNDYTWAQINKTTSDIADITTRSHTSLTDIGTNTHAQIDTHIASTANPHSVTKSQVGLGNVTNDSQVKRAEMGVADGVATLGSDGKVPSAQLPALALTDVYVVASEAAQLALTAQEGDVAVRTDQNKSYIHDGGTAGTMDDWQELLTPTDAVTSVNGQTGAVSLTTTNINEGTNLYYTDARARAALSGTSPINYNSSTGAFTLDTVGVTKGGTGLTSATVGDILYASASNTLSALTGNTTTTKKFLSQTGNGSAAQAPSWATLAITDLPSGSFKQARASGTNTAFNNSWTTIDSVSITLDVDSIVYAYGSCDGRFADTTVRSCQSRIASNDGSDTARSGSSFQTVGNASGGSLRSQLNAGAVFTLTAGTYTIKFQGLNNTDANNITTDNSEINVLSVPNR